MGVSRGYSSWSMEKSVRQFAFELEIEKIFLGIRNLEKGENAKNDLEQATGKKIFKLIEIDLSQINLVKNVAMSFKPFYGIFGVKCWRYRWCYSIFKL